VSRAFLRRVFIRFHRASGADTAPVRAATRLGIALAAACLVAFLVGLAAVFNRPESEDRPPRTWKLRWSASVVAAVALMFVSGLMTYGIVQSSLAVWRLRDLP